MKSQLASIFAQADTGWFGFLQTMRGPDFLLLYLVWFIISFGVVLVTRWRGNDSAWVTLAGLFVYEALGFLRIVIGSMHDLHRWTFLVLMMIFGGLIFLIRVNFNRSRGMAALGGVGVVPAEAVAVGVADAGDVEDHEDWAWLSS